MKKKIAVIPGDGIGVDVVKQGVEVINRIAELYGHDLTLVDMLVGGAAIDAYGINLRGEDLEEIKTCDAILFGAAGGPKWDHLPRPERPEAALGKIRRSFNLFANYRPAKIYEPLRDNSPLKDRIIDKGMDLMLIRDLTGGIYFNEKGTREGKYGHEAYDVECYSVMEIERVAKKAFEAAKARRGSVTSVEKANALESSKLWRETVTRVSKSYPEVELTNMLVDKAAMELACNPSRFDVLLTTSIFGDILSDEAGVATGSVGMLASAALNDENFGLYEPIHGTAPDIAGMGIANPLATILSVAMMFRITFGAEAEAKCIEDAVLKTLEDGYRTGDIYSESMIKVTTEEMGAKVVERLVKN